MKKGVKISIFVLVLFSLSLVQIVSAADSEGNLTEWRMYGRWINHTGWDGVAYPVIPYLSFAKFTNGPAVGIIWSQPKIVNGFVYETIAFGSGTSTLYQLNASNISQVISTGEFPADGSSHLIVVNGFVYIGSDDGNLYQINASNLSQIINTFTTGNIIESTPAVANGYLYIGSDDGKLYQLNASNVSQQINSFNTGTIVTSSPAIANGFVYFGASNTNIYQLNASNVSQQIALFDSGSGVGSGPAVYNGSVYVGSNDNKLYQLNASNVSQQINSFNTGGSVSASPAIANGYVYIASGNGKVFQLNASNVSKHIANYSVNVGEYANSLAIANGLAYLGTSDHIIYQLNASNVSKEIGRYVTSDVDLPQTMPAIANGYLYIGSDSSIYQINATNITQSVSFPQITVSSPANTVYNTTAGVLINFTASDSINSVNSTWYFNGTDNVPYTSETTINLSKGRYNFTFYANNSMGNVNSTLVSFSIGEIYSCHTISSSGEYDVMQDILEYNEGSCLTINSSDIRINGNNHTISGLNNMFATYYGINNTGFNNLSVNNLNISNFGDTSCVFACDGGAVYLSNSSNNNLSNLWAQGNLYGLKLVSNSNGSIVSSFNSSDFNPVFINLSSNTLIKDSLINSSGTPILDIQSFSSINNTILNVSYSNISISSDSQLIKKWYINVTVKNTGSTALQGANVSVYNSTNNLEFSELSNSLGEVLQSLIQEVYNGTNLSRNSYTINVSKSGYNSNSTGINIIDNTNVQINLSATTSENEDTSSSSSGSNGGTYTPIFWTKTFLESNQDFSQIKQIIKELEVKNRIKIKLNGEEHQIGIVELANNKIKINVSSETQQATLNVGDEKKFDINGDNYNDLSIKLISISNNKAMVVIAYVYEKVTQIENNNTTATPQEQTPEKKSKATLYLALILIVIVLILVTSIFIYKYRKTRY